MKTVNFEPEFISRMIPKLEWSVLKTAAESVRACILHENLVKFWHKTQFSSTRVLIDISVAYIHCSLALFSGILSISVYPSINLEATIELLLYSILPGCVCACLFRLVMEQTYQTSCQTPMRIMRHSSEPLTTSYWRWNWWRENWSAQTREENTPSLRGYRTCYFTRTKFNNIIYL